MLREEAELPWTVVCFQTVTHVSVNRVRREVRSPSTYTIMPFSGNLRELNQPWKGRAWSQLGDPFQILRAPTATLFLERLKLESSSNFVAYVYACRLSYFKCPWDDKSPSKGRGHSHATHSKLCCPIISLERQFKFGNGFDTKSSNLQILYSGKIYQVLALGWQLPPSGRGQGHITHIFRFWPQSCLLNRWS